MTINPVALLHYHNLMRFSVCAFLTPANLKTTPMSEPTPRFDYQTVWQSTDEALREEIIAFWKQNGAISDPTIAAERAHQVVAVARSQADQQIAGVCTVVKRQIADLGKQLYYYRTFIAPEYRNGFVVRRLLIMASTVLERWSHKHPDEDAAGIYLELENPTFSQHLRWAVWPRKNLEFVYIGKTPRGLERRILWFKHTLI